MWEREFKLYLKIFDVCVEILKSHTCNVTNNLHPLASGEDY
jgi:hypothetical protein